VQSVSLSSNPPLIYRALRRKRASFAPSLHPATPLLRSAVQARIIRQSMLKQGVLMAINGGMAAAAAYGIGRGLQAAFDLNETCG
jgi:hypothetical protein